MSRRTFEANKAIRLAWQKELELVQEGKGTRDWTKEQQRDILNPELGKAYDEDGKAFEGHHMKSAEAYPEYQGNPENIQFLSRIEHTQAHGGWQKPTNGYYDYITGTTYDFGDNEFTPCKVIKLSNPVITVETLPIVSKTKPTEQTKKERSSGTDPPIMGSEKPAIKPPSVSKSTKKVSAKQPSKGSMMDGLVNAVNSIKDFSDKHPVLTTIGKVGLGITATVVTGKIIDTKIKAKPSGKNTGNALLNQQTIKALTETAIDTVSKFDFKKSESALKQLGYTVAKKMALSDSDRQKILQKAISNGTMSKKAICAFLENNINLHKNQAAFAEAVRKWISDLAFIRNI